MSPVNGGEILIDLKTMSAAIKNTFNGRMGDNEAFRLAEFVMNFFGYDDHVLDNYLESEDRNIFYMLEDEGLISVRQEEIIVKVGQLWRINYWILKKKEILKRANSASEESNVFSYEQFYQTIWNSVSSEATPLGRRQ